MDDYSDIPTDQRMLLRLIDANMNAHNAKQEGAMKVLVEKMDGVVTKVDHRMDAMDKRQDQADKRADAMDRRFEACDDRAAHYDERIATLEHAYTSRKDMPDDMKKLSDRVKVLETKEAKHEGAGEANRGWRDWIRPVLVVLAAAAIIAMWSSYWSAHRAPSQVTMTQQVKPVVNQNPTQEKTGPAADQ